MAHFKLGNLAERTTVTATSGGTLILTSSSSKYQILTGAANHTVVLPDATTLKEGVIFSVVNQSTGDIDVEDDGNNALYTVSSNATAQFLLKDNSLANGVWTQLVSGTAGPGGLDYAAPSSVKTTDYTILNDDDGKTILVDASSNPVEITLPSSPNAGFKVTVKDASLSASINRIWITPTLGKTIDGTDMSDRIASDGYSISYVFDGSNWTRAVSSVLDPIIPAGYAYFVGGSSNNIVTGNGTIDYIDFYSAGTASDFGDLTSNRMDVGAAASKTRGVFFGGTDNRASFTILNVIDYINFSTVGNATSFGSIGGSNRTITTGAGNNIYGLFAGGSNSGGVQSGVDVVTIATTGNSVNYGSLTVARTSAASSASAIRSFTVGGFLNGAIAQNTIDYTHISNLGTYIDYADLSIARAELCATGSATRIIAITGNDGSGSNFFSNIEYFSTVTAANATTFGNISTSSIAIRNAATSNNVRALMTIGYTNSSATVSSLNIEQVTLSTTGNATDYADLSEARGGIAGCSNVHGGL